MPRGAQWAVEVSGSTVTLTAVSKPDDATVFAVDAPWPWEDSLVAQRGFGWHPDAGNMLLLVEDNVTEEMCNDLAGPVDVALLAHGPLVGLLVRFSGGWGWAETMVWRAPGDGIPEFLRTGAPSDHLFFKAVLVDRVTKRIAHMRAFTVSPHLTKMLMREVNDRWTTEVTWPEAQRFREEWNTKHPSINSALKASLARAHGGD